jgi:putative Mg2+ transporter-C (MgtC) family protein
MMLARVIVAAVMAGALGWERAHAGKAAGLRTHMIVGVASALFVALADVVARSVGGADPTRTIHAVATGVGFLGAGVVFVARRNDRVVGLTTAASIWATAAVATAAALGHVVLAVGTTLLLLLVLRWLTHLAGATHGARAPSCGP